MVAILIPLILSRWRSTEGVPLTSHRKPNDQLIEFSPEDSFNPTLDKFQKLFLELVIEDRKSGELKPFCLYFVYILSFSFSVIFIFLSEPVSLVSAFIVSRTNIVLLFPY